MVQSSIEVGQRSENVFPRQSCWNGLGHGRSLSETDVLADFLEAFLRCGVPLDRVPAPPHRDGEVELAVSNVFHPGGVRMARAHTLVRFCGVAGGGTGSGSQDSAINQASTFLRAQGVLRRKVRLDFTDGSNWKQRIGIRQAISFQPCRWTNRLTMCSKVIPCSGSRGWEAGAVTSGFPFVRRFGGGEFADKGRRNELGANVGFAELPFVHYLLQNWQCLLRREIFEFLVV